MIGLKNFNKANNINNIFVLDTESYIADSNYVKKNNRTDAYLAYIKNVMNPQLNCLSFVDFGKKGSALDKIMDYIKKLNKPITIYCHNLGWDGDFLVKWLLEKKYKYIHNLERKKSERKKGFSVFRKNKQKYFKVSWCFYKKDKNGKAANIITVEFRDSFALIPISVKEIGKSIGLLKTQDLNKEDFYGHDIGLSLTNEFVDYCKRDVDIIIEALKIFNSAPFFKKYRVNPFSKITIGSLTLALFKQFLVIEKEPYNFKQLLRISFDSNKIGKMFYKGGLVQFNPVIIKNLNLFNSKLKAIPNIPYTFSGDFKKLDINSMYPSICLKKLPVGEPILTTNKDFIENENNIDYSFFIEFKCDFVEPKTDLYLLPKFENFKNGRYFNSAENYTGFFIAEEFRTLEKFYKFKNIKILKVYKLKNRFIFKKFIETFYEKRLEYKKLNSPFQLVIKLVLNTLYGKMGQRPEIETEIILTEKDANILIKKLEKSKNGEITYLDIKYRSLYKNVLNDSVDANFNAYGYKCLKLVKCLDDFAMTNNVFTAASITALARVKLMDSIDSIGWNNWIYSDTDSMIILNSELLNLIEMDDKKLGAFKLEGTFNVLNCEGAKRYILGEIKNNDELLDFVSGKIQVEKLISIENESAAFAGISKKITFKDACAYCALGDSYIFKKGKKTAASIDGGKILIDTDLEIKLPESRVNYGL